MQMVKRKMARMEEAGVKLYERSEGGVWLALFAPLPLACTPFWVQVLRSGTDEAVPLTMRVVWMALFALSLMYGVVKCDVTIAMISVMVSIVLGVSVTSAGVGGIPSGLLMSAALVAGTLTATKVTNVLYDRMRANQGEEVQVITEEVISEQKEKCAKCHCRRYCAFQVDGVADRYKVGSAMRSNGDVESGRTG